jgi:hypothetical protein
MSFRATPRFNDQRQCHVALTSVGTARYGSTARCRREEIEMKAYLIATETVKDEAMFGKYRQEVMKTLAALAGSSSSAAGT